MLPTYRRLPSAKAALVAGLSLEGKERIGLALSLFAERQVPGLFLSLFVSLSLVSRRGAPVVVVAVLLVPVRDGDAAGEGAGGPAGGAAAERQLEEFSQRRGGSGWVSGWTSACRSAIVKESLWLVICSFVSGW